MHRINKGYCNDQLVGISLVAIMMMLIFQFCFMERLSDYSYYIF